MLLNAKVKCRKSFQNASFGQQEPQKKSNTAKNPKLTYSFPIIPQMKQLTGVNPTIY